MVRREFLLAFLVGVIVVLRVSLSFFVLDSIGERLYYFCYFFSFEGRFLLGSYIGIVIKIGFGVFKIKIFYRLFLKNMLCF